jgi:restriction system protein
MAVPTYDKLFNPLLKAMRSLGGSGSVSEIDDKVGEILKLSDDEINEIHRENRTKLSYRLAWARNYLKRYGLLENSSRGVWALTPLGLKTTSVNEAEVKKAAKTLKAKLSKPQNKKGINEAIETETSIKFWQDILLGRISKISPAGFEKLCQRLLRESGFIQVEVTGRSGDGGIDGKGIVRLGGFLGFHVIFQCKRYSRSVSPDEIRDFRGAMIGRADKGLFITTGSFTKGARTEASRDGAPPIDLVDGEQLAEKMKELGLGIRIRTEEVVEVDTSWFDSFK